MADPGPIVLTSNGCEQAGRLWRPAGPWIGVLPSVAGDRRAALLAAAVRVREADLFLMPLDPGILEAEQCLEILAGLSQPERPDGLLVGESWQETVAGRCDTLTGAAADLGLVDAVRIVGDGRWQGHHLLAGAVEAYLAQIPAVEPPVARAVVLGDGMGALAVVMAAVRRGVSAIQLVAPDPAVREKLAGHLDAASGWPASVVIQLSECRDQDQEPAGFWLRATAAAISDEVWLPDTAGRDPCLLLDVIGATTVPPLGFTHLDAGSVQVIAAGLATAWYLGPPIPWDDLRAALDI